MANQIVTQTAVTVEAVDALQAEWEASCEAQRIAHAASIAAPRSLAAVYALKAAVEAETVAKDAWKAATAVLQAMWRAEDAEYDAFLCAQYDAMDNAVDYPYGYDTSMPLPYTITSQGYTYLDHHYQTDSEAGMLAAGGDSPYGDGTTGYIQPTPAHPFYINGVCDMDALSRYDDLSY